MRPILTDNRPGHIIFHGKRTNSFVRVMCGSLISTLKWVIGTLRVNFCAEGSEKVKLLSSAGIEANHRVDIGCVRFD